jgi:hypothetical protein
MSPTVDDPSASRPPTPPGATSTRPTPGAVVAFAWLLVGMPLLWGVFQTLKKAAALFHEHAPPHSSVGRG